ncbi:MAG: GC-type dockerin domain-anchored protein [Phycisphaerales bacterium]
MRGCTGSRCCVIGVIVALCLSAPVLAQFEEVAALRPGDLEESDEFGSAVALLDDRLLISAPGADGTPGSGDRQGAAYLFDVATRTLVARLADAGFGLFEDYGASVALGPTVAIVGAPNGDLGGSDGLIFIYDARDGTLQDLYRVGGLDATDDFGGAVAIDGEVAVVGAIRADGVQTNSGAAFLIDLTDPTDPQELSQLDPADGRFSDEIGTAVAIDGNLVLVGAPRKGVAGAAYLFDITDPAAPIELVKMTPPGTGSGGLFGAALAIAGDLAVVGSPTRNVGDIVSAGAAFLYDISDSANPVQIAELVDPAGQEFDRFGGAVAINGEIVVVGVDTTFNDAGRVLAFDAQSGALIGEAAPDMPVSDALYGGAVALDGDRLIVGASGDDSRATDAGAAYLFAFTSACRADLDGDGSLTIFDFLQFQNLFSLGDPTADFDNDGNLTLFDFLAFQNEFAAGC